MKKIILIQLLFSLLVQFAFGQNGKITGKVTNSVDGSPIPGVNINIAGSSKGTSTDFDGTFSITAPNSATLIFSFLGFETQKIKVNEAILNVKLKELTSTLDQVVVVGSTVRTSRKELGNAITSVKASELNRAQANSLSSALQGKVAGAQISQNSGDPSGGFSIKLRGTSSILGSSDPLYVIDGVVISNLTSNVSSIFVSDSPTTRPGQNRSVDINPNDIETIDILNGGAAAAIYGSRAANGVVIITTKKGKSGETRFTFSTSTTLNTIRKKLDLNLENKQFYSSSAALFPISNSTPSPITPTNNILLLFNNNAGAQTPKRLDKSLIDVKRYDYQDEIFTTGYGSDTSAQGGNSSTKYMMSLGYLSNEGIVKNTDFKRLGIKLSLQNQITNKLKLSLGLNYINSFSNEKPDGNSFGSPLNSLNITNNTYDLNSLDLNGNYKAVDPGRINPLTIINKFKITQQTNRVIADATLNYKPFNRFNADFIVGIDTYNQVGNTFIPKFTYASNIFPNGYVSESTNRVNQLNNDLNLRYDFDLTKNIKSTTAGGYNIQIFRDKSTVIAGQNLKPFVETVNAFNVLEAGFPQSSESNLNVWGYYLQQTFGLFDKLFLTAAIRNDASTVFSKANRSQIYPKLSGSYVISKHEIFEKSIISTLRLRASWGESGSLTAIGPYTRFTNYNAPSLGPNSTYQIAGNIIGNPNLVPERNVSSEYGGDIGLFKDRFNLSFTYYNSDIKDLLFSVQTAPSIGALGTTDNIGKMNNEGYEIALNMNLIQKKDFNLNLNLNYSTNKNTVTDLPQKRFEFLNSTSGVPTFAEVGQPIGIYIGTYFAKNPDGTLLLDPQGFPQRERGNFAQNTIGRDANGQPLGTPLTKIIGDPNPDYIISMGGSLSYKKFGLSFLFDGVQGVDVFDADYRTRQGVGSGELIAKELRGELLRGYIESIYQIQEFRIVDGSYIKLREVSLDYSFGKITNFFSNLTITASGRNLYSWDKFTSYDPEANSAGQSNVARYNFGAIPIPRSFALALKFQF